ncbi:long-chain-fatty-acid--CoA ligase [Marinobacterium nitratireducens]|uniref:Long-chain-fatty-acid--CoA ligase n=1 Tax=Marinobacterium nitratireducens TaxID=518897 RepID=A0A917Z8V4_9GAMM|nr:fatty acid--CoA ligase [Marinobacterium nitratireducens]GGO78458.1 long-chain-fatty-acid--CoA ligase [Marinobacterium nitratireducens]
MQTRIMPPAEEAYHFPLLIKQLLLSNQRYERENGIVYRDGQRFSYREFNERVCRLANMLGELGVKAGDTVAVMDWDSHRYLECFFAVPMIGAVLHTVNIRLSAEQMVYTMNHAEDKVVLVHEDFLPLAEGFSNELTTVDNWILLSEGDTAPATRLPAAGEYEALLRAADSHYDFPDFDENSIATTFYTSGTTGNPKGVFFSHRQLVLHTLNMISALTTINGKPLLSNDTVYMPVTPMFHVHAWGIPYAATMLGAQQIYPGRYEPDRLVRTIREEGVTFSHCVPTIMQMLLHSEEAKKTDFSKWNLMIGGSALPEGLARTAADLGIEIFSGYGMSETCPLMSTTRLDRNVRTLDSEQQIAYRKKAGVPTNLVDIQIWGPDGKPLPHDGVATGEVVTRGPWMTQSYLNEPEKGNELWQGGWLHTGDVAAIHPDGYVEIRDRIKDVIKTGGEWLSSLELESLISSHPDVDSVAVVGVPDERWDERPHALVIARNDELTADILKLHLLQYVKSGHINKWAIPEQIDFVDDIPKTSVGKIDKKRIRAQLA